MMSRAVRPSRRRRSCRTCLLWLALPPLALISFIFGIPYFVPGPGVPPLENPRRDVPEAENAWGPLIEAVGRVEGKLDADGEYPTAKHPSAAVAAYVAANTTPIQVALTALERPALQVPEERLNSPDGKRPELAELRALARLILQHGYVRVAAGDVGGGLREHLAVVRLGRRWQDGGGYLIDLLVGVAIEIIGLRAIANDLSPQPWPADTPARGLPHIARLPRLTRAETAALERTAAAVAEPTDPTAVLGRALAVEFHFYPAQAPVPRWLSRNLIYDQVHTRGLQRRMIHELTEQAGRQAYDRDLAGTLLQAGIDGRTGLYNAVGRRITGLVAPVYKQVAEKQDQLLFERDSVIAQIAMRRFHDAKGRLPRDWAELTASGLLPAAPIDPCSGRPVHYDPRRAILWSNGPDLDDDRARVDRLSTQATDVVLPIVFAGAREATP